MPSIRRSGRQSGARTVYTEDPFASAGLSDPSDSEGATATKAAPRRRRRKDESPSDDEFMAVSGAGGTDEHEEDSNGEEEEDEPEEEEEDEPTVQTPRKERVVSRPRYHKKRRPDGTIAPDASETHMRGILAPSDHVSKGMHYTMAFGTDERDALTAVYSRDRWFSGLDSGLPTRESLDKAGSMPDYGCGATLGVTPEEVKRERTTAWDWYYDEEIGERFRKRQRVETIKEAVARRVYLPQPKKGKHTILVGPAEEQHVLELDHHEAQDFGQFWGETKSDTKIRQGWMLNLGQKIMASAWAPNQDGLNQYLAVAAPITEEQKKDAVSGEGVSVSAFQPSYPYPSALQLWEFKAKKSDTPTTTLDMGSKPRLRLVLCSNWGDLRRISWCPIGREKREEDEKGNTQPIGLLASVWGDGRVRVLDIRIRRGHKGTEFVQIHSPVFEAKPPSTICTCVTWLSPSDIAVGCANGFVGVWNIAHAETLPLMYRPIHVTYILNIVSAYPTHPQTLTTIGMDGETRYWSLLDPQAEVVMTGRMRIASSHLSYSPVLQSFFSSDENEFARILPLRRFFNTNYIAKMPSTVSTMAPCSPWHPCVMYGGAGGEVVATNPLRRLLYAKEQQLQQTWFKHTWVQGPQKEGPGVSRFYDGFQAERQNLSRNLAGDSKLVDGVLLATIHEEGTHVTALGWNPNQACAAWASAALGCGLVRVEDLAI
ncbi:uncharacterized protein PFLUO_LOCUS6834 [Penicillium psychrofluorescens]|uniref:uncharacterized protein n=1 Tax=Penicillium psychrofluorescens TaxID=3158075 RepID=UPI003CCD4C2F